MVLVPGKPVLAARERDEGQCTKGVREGEDIREMVVGECFGTLRRKEAVHVRQVGRCLEGVEEEEHQWRRLRQMRGGLWFEWRTGGGVL